MTCRRFVSTLVLLLSSVSTVSAADQQPRNQIEIDRSVLQDLHGYEPPAMFGWKRPESNHRAP